MTWASKAEKLLPRRAPPNLPPPPNPRYYHNNHTRTSSAPQLHQQPVAPFDSPVSPSRTNGVVSYPSSTINTLDETPEPRESESSDPPAITITLPTPAPTPAPPEFQSSPVSPTITHPKATKIDFFAANLPCYRNHYAAVIDNLFSPTECRLLLEVAEKYAAENASPGTPLSHIWSPALITSSNNNRRNPANQSQDVTVRKCSRIVMDSEALSEQIFYKLLPYLQEISEVRKLRVKRGRTVGPGPRSYARVRLKGMHSSLKFLKYHPGDHFRPHTDGMYISEDRTQASYYSLIIFLVSPADGHIGFPEELSNGEYPGGGCTRIWEDKNQWPLNPVTGVRDRPPGWKPRFLDIEPLQGRVLVFEQNGLRHSGEEVTAGVKYILKADLLHGEIDGGGGRPWEGP